MVDSLALAVQFDPDPLLEQFQWWVLRGSVFVVTFVAVYATGRLLLLPPLLRAVRHRNQNNPTLLEAIRLYVRVVLAVVAVPIGIAVAGFGNIFSGSALVVAAGTLAVGVAGQDVISNLVSGVFLVADANFNVGDYIEWDNSGGRVAKIGLRTTRVRTPKGELVTVPNNDLSTMPVRHPFDEGRYRIDQRFTVAYDEDIETVTTLVEDIADDDDRVLEAPAPAVHVTKLGDSAVELVAQYWVEHPTTVNIQDIQTRFADRAKDHLQDHEVTVAPANAQDLSGEITVDRPPGAES